MRAIWAVITLSAASSPLYQQPSLSPGEFIANTKVMRAIHSAGLVKDARTADVFDDDPPLLGKDPAVKRFPTWQ